MAKDCQKAARIKLDIKQVSDSVFYLVKRQILN